MLVQEAKPRKRPRVITSFNESYYRRCGKDFIDSWQRHWPASVGLTVYYEGDAKAFDMETFGISWRPVEEVEHLETFMKMLCFPIMHGILGDKYDVWFDARHARKVFMQMHALRTYKGKVFWIDSDCVTHTDVPEDFLDSCLPDDKLACYLGRDGWYFTESGFIGFNADHPLAQQFYSNYLGLFTSGTFLTNSVHGRLCWHDCGGFDAIRKIVFKGYEDQFVNLAEHVRQGHMHPFQVSAPGQYMNHMKGSRKDTKQLRPEDTVN